MFFVKSEVNSKKASRLLPVGDKFPVIEIRKIKTINSNQINEQVKKVLSGVDQGIILMNRE